MPRSLQPHCSRAGTWELMTRDGGHRQQERSQSHLQAQLWRVLDSPKELCWPCGPSGVGVGRPWGPAQRGSGDSRIQQRGGWGSPGPGGGADIRVGWPSTVKPALRLKQGGGWPWGLGMSLTAWEKMGCLCSQMRPRLGQSGDLGAQGCWAQQQQVRPALYQGSPFRVPAHKHQGLTWPLRPKVCHGHLLRAPHPNSSKHPPGAHLPLTSHRPPALVLHWDLRPV